MHELQLIPVDRDLTNYVGKRTNGGCSDCAAYFDAYEGHCTRGQCAHIYHDGTCPFFGELKNGTAQPG